MPGRDLDACMNARSRANGTRLFDWVRWPARLPRLLAPRCRPLAWPPAGAPVTPCPLPSRRRPQYNRGRRVAADIASGLAFLHHCRVLHLE